MKKEIAFVFVIMLLSFSFVSAVETDSMTVTTNVLANEISISVPDSVIFGDIAPGYLSERQDIDIVNTGTTDISVSASLSNYGYDIFTNIGFKKLAGDDELTNLRYFDFEIMKPTKVGGERVDGIYMYLDLTEYEGNITGTDHNATVIFTAVPL